MRNKIALVLLVLSLMVAMFSVVQAADAPQQAQAQQIAIQPELAQVINNINLSYQVLDRENTSVKTYIQYLIAQIVEKDKLIETLQAQLPKKR
ncbi:MAG: hypothetical protein ABIH39_07605 [Candidatus Margulisiibacteriota bacterium]